MVVVRIAMWPVQSSGGAAAALGALAEGDADGDGVAAGAGACEVVAVLAGPVRVERGAVCEDVSGDTEGEDAAAEAF